MNKSWQPGGIFYGETPKKEILPGRTEYIKKFDEGNGLVNLVFGGPFHYQDASGAWQDINLRINEGPADYFNSENKFISQFSRNIDDGMSLSYRNVALSFGINTRIAIPKRTPLYQNPEIILADNVIRYKNYCEGTDLEYELSPDAIQHRMIFRNKDLFLSASSRESITIQEEIVTPTGCLISDDLGIISSGRRVQGNIRVIVNGDTVYTIIAPHIWDASFTGDYIQQISSADKDNFRTTQTSLAFIGSNKIQLTSGIPASWLVASNRVYPVVFDPTVAIGNVVNFNSSYRYPFNSCRQQRVSQILFRKADINAGGINTTGTITDIGFFQNTAVPIVNNNVQVKMQDIAASALTSPTLTTTGWTNVYGPSSQNFTSGSNTWRTLTLSNPFVFTNTNNLFIEVRFSNSTFTTGCNCDNTSPGGYWGWYNAPYAGHRWAYSNSTASPPNGGDCNYSNSPEGNPAYGYFIPATRITINTTGGCVPVTINGNPQSQTVVAPASAQFSVSISGTTPAYQWEMSTNSGSSWSNVPAASPYSGSTSSQLTVNPTSAAMNGYRYRCKITNNCTSPAVTSNASVLTVNAAGCTTVLTPTASSNFPASGGTGSFSINVTPNTCSWSASENQTWLNITSLLNGTGDAVLTYSVSANTSSTRSGVITVNGQSYTVNQLGIGPATTYTISGRVIETGSVGLPGVVISTTPNQGTATTDAQGYYTLAVPLGYFGSVKPALSAFTFTPVSRVVNSSNFSNKDFDAIAVSIKITSSSIIPPWQREADDYSGTISVQLNNTTTNSWHLEADVYSGLTKLGSVRFPTTTVTSYQFNTALSSPAQNQQLKNFSKNSRRIEYVAVFDANEAIRDTIKSTNIIEKKWDKKNLVYWRDSNSPDILKIPIRWSPNLSNQAIFVKIKRYNSTSWILPLFSSTQGDSYSPHLYDSYPDVHIGKYPVTLKNNSNVNEFSVDSSSGYCEIKGANSNIYSTLLFPGDFKYEVYGSSGVIESGYFDLTKIGRINGSSTSKKIIVVIGGIMNECEISADTLRNYNSVSNNSTNTYSVAEFIRNSIGDYSTWYIAQGNSNLAERNGYDIGIAIDRIRKLNNISPTDPSAEINIICHSKGGLDIRALLSVKNNSIYFNKSFEGTPFSFRDSAIASVIKKVVFLGTPHLGAPIEDILHFLSLDIANSPGALDLQIGSSIISSLSSSATSLPNNIKYCNVTGFSMYPLYGYGDLVVPELSSLSLLTPPNTKLQLRQLGLSAIFLNHFSIHKSKRLDYTPFFLEQGFMCYNGITNLIKIKNFIQTGDISESCNSPLMLISIQGVSFYKSKVSNANVFFKKELGTIFLGTTDADGDLFYETYLPVDVRDSLIVQAPGVEEIRMSLNKSNFNNKYINKIATFKSQIGSDKILYPVFLIPNETAITQNATVQIQVSGQNVNQTHINVHGNDTLFVPLLLNNGTAFISLDTGYNKILVRLTGVDTVVLKREIFYLPDPYLNQFTRTLSVLAIPQYSGVRMYVSNAFYGLVSTGGNSFRIFKDNVWIRFSGFGYSDTTYMVDSVTNIILNLPLKSYSSLVDSNVFDFSNRPNPQYWKTITVKKLSTSDNVRVSAMQYDDPFTGMGLKPQSRKFVFRHLANSDPAYLKTAIALDQINTPDKDSIYLLQIEGNKYVKHKVNQPGITEYDPEVQKVEFDQLDFSSADKHAIVLMQKQPPVMKIFDSTWHSGETIKLPLSKFVQDPDSIKNDIIGTSADSKVAINGNWIYVTAPINFTGTLSFSLTAEHDFLTASKTYTMKVIRPEAYVPSAFTPNNDGLNDVLVPAFLGKILKCSFAIYNRSGQKVFETSDCLSGWDGKINGREQGTNTFVYVLTYQFAGDSEIEKQIKGTVTLIR